MASLGNCANASCAVLTQRARKARDHHTRCHVRTGHRQQKLFVVVTAPMAVDEATRSAVQAANCGISRRRRLGHVPQALALWTAAMSAQRRHGGVGLTRHHRVPRRAAPGSVARRPGGARMGALCRGGDARRIRGGAQCLLDELRPARAASPGVAGGRPRRRAAGRAVGRRARPVRWSVPHRQGVHRGRCVLRADRVPCPDL